MKLYKPYKRFYLLYQAAFNFSQQSQYQKFQNQQYQEFESTFFGDMEINMLIYQFSEKFDMDKEYKQQQRMQKMSEEERNKLKKEEDIIMDKKLKEQEKSKVYINFLNKWSINLMKHTPSSILNEQAIRCFTGSRDVPRDFKKAQELFHFSEQNIKNEQEKQQIEFYKLLQEKYYHKDIYNKNLRNVSDKEEKIIQQMNNKLFELAKNGNEQALYTFGKDAYQQSQFFAGDQKKIKNLQLLAYEFLIASLNKGIYSANYYLGKMYLEGLYIKKDNKKALNYFIAGASRYDPRCYFELARLYSEGQIVEKDLNLEFLYLKRSAENGYVIAQHMVGKAYHIGKIVKKDDYLALAWLRESIRNGFYPSYLNAGDLLYTGGVNLQKNKMFALANYFVAYRHGFFQVHQRIQDILQGIYDEEGIDLRERFKLINIPKEHIPQYKSASKFSK